MLMLLAAAVVMACISACSTTTSQARNKSLNGHWTHFNDTAGDFSVLMPMRPQEAIKVHSDAGGPAVEAHEFIVDPEPSMELGVIYNDFPESLSYIEQIGSPWFFDTIQDAAMKRLGTCRLIDTHDGKFTSHPMRDVRFEAVDKRLLCQTRIIVVGHRMYQLIVVSSAGVDVSRAADTFFSSSSLLHDAP
jgi:hypothetical protein